MEHNGHYVTGMSNRIVWGMPHVFAIFLIVAASGVLNVASIASVFGRELYKPLARLSGLLALTLLAGGLAVLVLDLGRPERLIVAMTHYNFKSIFAWNIFLYTGFYAIVAVYLWTMFERRMNDYSKPAGLFAFVWRLILTTGTGSIFGFLVAREPYDSALLAPMFIIMSFSFGLAIFVLVLMAACRWTGRPLGDVVLCRLRNLLGVFVAAVLYFVAIHHLTNLYIARQHDVERFFLWDGGIYHRAVLVRAGPGRRRPAPRAVVRRHIAPRPRSRGGVRDPGRACAALCPHHRRSGLPAADVPGKGSEQQLLRRRGRSLRAEPAGSGARRGRRGAGAGAHRRGAQGIAVPAAQPGGRRRRFRGRMNRLFISAAHKSSGKTTLCIGLCAALRARGEVVQPFKKGPDYIDPLWLGLAAGRPCYNLDAYLMGADEIRAQVARSMRGATLGIIEGNKGLYDGLDLEGSNSNAAMAALLGTPVVLVIDARGMTRGIAPLILGYQAFDREHPHRRRDPEPARGLAPRSQAARGDPALHRRAGARRRAAR